MENKAVFCLKYYAVNLVYKDWPHFLSILAIFQKYVIVLDVNIWCINPSNAPLALS